MTTSLRVTCWCLQGYCSLLGVSAIFYVVAFISLVQLLICCFAEYKRLKNPSFLKACRITTQKFLYFVVFLASLLRATYFTQPESAQWAYYLMSAYYPLLMTCASLVVCFWAEVGSLNIFNLFHTNFLTLSFKDVPPSWYPMGTAVSFKEFSRLSSI